MKRLFSLFFYFLSGRVAFLAALGYTEEKYDGGTAMRFHVMWRRDLPGTEFTPFFETNDIYEAKDFAMRLAFEEVNIVYVLDTKTGSPVRDFDNAIYRE